MTLVDNETGRDIINPYVTLYSPDRRSWAALNTETLGETQEDLIHPLEESRIRKLIDQGVILHPVVATVAKQNYPLDSAFAPFARNIRTEGASDPLALITLGFLPEELVRQRFPQSFKYLTQKRD